jgi:hypothetical protein
MLFWKVSDGDINPSLEVLQLLTRYSVAGVEMALITAQYPQDVSQHMGPVMQRATVQLAVEEVLLAPVQMGSVVQTLVYVLPTNAALLRDSAT